MTSLILFSFLMAGPFDEIPPEVNQAWPWLQSECTNSRQCFSHEHCNNEGQCVDSSKEPCGSVGDCVAGEMCDLEESPHKCI